METQSFTPAGTNGRKGKILCHCGICGRPLKATGKVGRPRSYCPECADIERRLQWLAYELDKSRKRIPMKARNKLRSRLWSIANSLNVPDYDPDTWQAID